MSSKPPICGHKVKLGLDGQTYTGECILPPGHSPEIRTPNDGPQIWHSNNLFSWCEEL